jgi:DNA-binding MarR family transcriptional regulator
MTITSNELKVLRALYTNNFTDDDPMGEAWADCINDAKEDSGIEGKALSGVCANLSAKGLTQSGGKGRDRWIRLTPAGLAAAQANVSG